MIIVIEGSDQAGKKTQTTLLAQALKKSKIKTKTFSFPDYTTPLGKEIDRFLHGKRKFPAQVIHCLLAANRWEKLDQIKAAQEQNAQTTQWSMCCLYPTRTQRLFHREWCNTKQLSSWLKVLHRFTTYPNYTGRCWTSWESRTLINWCRWKTTKSRKTQ